MPSSLGYAIAPPNLQDRVVSQTVGKVSIIYLCYLYGLFLVPEQFLFIANIQQRHESTSIYMRLEQIIIGARHGVIIVILLVKGLHVMKMLPFKESRIASIGMELEFQIINPHSFSLM